MRIEREIYPHHTLSLILTVLTLRFDILHHSPSSSLQGQHILYPALLVIYSQNRRAIITISIQR
jgi:hypothetical protein